MSLQERILSKSNSYNYYKEKNESLEKRVEELEKELEETIDAFVDGNYKTPEMESGTEHPESWQWWFNPKTGEKTDKCKYTEYCAGEPWIPIKKAAFYNWASAISFSVMKDGKPYHIGYISGTIHSLEKSMKSMQWKLSISKVSIVSVMLVLLEKGQTKNQKTVTFLKLQIKIL